MANVSSSNGLEKRPKLRFPGFDEPWCSHKFSSVFSFLQNNTLSRAELDATGDVLDIHYGDVLIKYGSILDATDNTIPHIIPGHESTNYDYLQDGDIIVADTAEDETVGKTIELLNISGRKIEAGLHTVPCRPLFPFASMYLGYYMNTSHYHKQLIPLMQGIKVLSISKGNISKTKISSPQTIAEQEKISRFLYLLDQRATAQSKIIDALKKYKRGALKAVFTQQVSFSAKPQKWDKYKMGDLISLQSGQDFAPAEYNDQEIGVPYMTGASCIVKGETVVSRWTQTPRCYAYKGDTLLVCKGSGSGAVVRLTQEKVHIARQFMSLRANEKMTSDFCYYLTGFLSDRIKRNATGLIEGIDRGTVLNQTVFLPPLHEQKKIARFFSKLDFTITAHENMLDTLINEITGLMQRLFI